MSILIQGTQRRVLYGLLVLASLILSRVKIIIHAVCNQLNRVLAHPMTTHVYPFNACLLECFKPGPVQTPGLHPIRAKGEQEFLLCLGLTLWGVRRRGGGLKQPLGD